jgi:uncharacterized protein DUF4214
MLFLITLLFAQTSTAPNLTIKPVVVACDSNKFLARAYQDVLGRPIDSASTTYWLGAMKNGASRTQVATQMLRSAEHVNMHVRELYNTYLHRPPDGGAAAFVSMLQQGASSEQVEAMILASPEYFAQRAGSTNAGWVAALFQDVLGRAPDPQASNFFMQQLASNSRTTVAQQVLSSNEARQRRLNALYNHYLHRPASGAVPPGSLDQVAAAIIGSEEYCRR